MLEAWEGLRAIRCAVADWRSGDPEARHELWLVCHRLRGTAALYGWHRLAAVAEKLETWSDAQPPTQLDGDGSSLILKARVTMSEMLEEIASSGSDDVPSAEALLESWPPAPGDRATRETEPKPVSAAAIDESDAAAETEAESSNAAAVVSPDDELCQFRLEKRGDLEFFIPEAEELLETIEAAVSRLDNSPDDLAALESLFRAVHTLKGAALMVGCSPPGELAHQIEDVLVPHHRQRRTLTRSTTDALLIAARSLRAMFDVVAGQRQTAAEMSQRASAALAALVAAETDEPETSTAAVAPASPLRSRVEPLVTKRVTEPVSETSAAAPASVTADAESVRLRVDPRRLDTMLDLVGELVVSQRRVELDLEKLETVSELLSTSRERMAQAAETFQAKYLQPGLDVGDRPVGKEWTADLTTSPGVAGGQSSLEESLDLFGELELDRYDEVNVLARRVTEIAADFAEIEQELETKNSQLHQDWEHQKRLLKSLRREVGRTRLVPLRPLLERFVRLTEDLVAETGKDIRIEFEAEGLEAEALLIERLSDPLLHLLQNAVVHGIESAAIRRTVGKPEQGRISLLASSHGTAIRLAVEDDGAGIDVEELKRRAASQLPGEAADVETMSDEEALRLIFLPGLSTAADVSRRAGRGVGMSVVENAVLRLNGDLDIDTQRGHGTTFTLTLPVTVALSNAVIVEVGGARYGLPARVVKQVLEKPRQELEAAQAARQKLRIEEEELELCFLADLFGLATPSHDAASVPVLVLAAGGRRLVLAVDRVEGLEEVVLRPLDRSLVGHPLFSGGSIAADGRLTLLVDVVGLLARRRQLGAAPAALATARLRPTREEATDGVPILVVDDSYSVRRILARTLERVGYRVTTASDGLDALAALREEQFAAVITDLEMPRFNGYELIADLRRRAPGLPILVITSRVGPKHEELARRMGVADYLGKPFEEQELTSKLRRALEAAAAADESEPLRAVQ